MALFANFATLLVIVSPFVAAAMIPFYLKELLVWPAILQVPFWFYWTVLGITLSFHREHTHGSVKFTLKVRYFWLIAGLLSLEGLLRNWVADHRAHHIFTDEEGDPHSPVYGFRSNFLGVLHGLIHAHFGWLVGKKKSECESYAGHILRDKGLVMMDRLFPLWAVLTFALPGFISWIFVQTTQSFWAGVFWGGVIRIGLVHHVTWMVNSWGHFHGERPFKSTPADRSANNKILAILSAGEGLHRNHHAFQDSARLAVNPGEIDPGFKVIKWHEKRGHVLYLKTPSEKRIREARISA